MPLLQNFSPADYNHMGKIWDIDTSLNGLVYMASDKGLIEYDGERWKSFKGSDGIIRSVDVVNDSLIYTGADLDFGVWKRNVYKDFEYTSLYPFKEDLSELSEEFWNVHSLNNSIYFISASNIYVYRNQNLTKIPVSNKIINSFILEQKIHFADEESLYRLDELSPEKLIDFAAEQVVDVVGIYRQQDDIIAITQNSGILRYSATGNRLPVNARLSQTLETANVFSFEKIEDRYLVFGTILKGVYISDLNGNIVHHINKNKGLQNNTILKTHYNSAGKLWLSMDYGVSYLDLANEFTFFYDYRGDFGTGYSAVLMDGQFYLGTNQGLYRTDWEQMNNNTEYYNFDLLPGSEGQVWTMKMIDNRLLIGHDRGLFILKENEFRKIGNQQGIWTLTRYGDYLLAGTYNGISIFSETNGEWTFLKQMDLILGSCNQIVVENENTIWVNIPNFGVIKALLNDNLYPEKREIFLTNQFNGDDHYLVNGEDGIEIKTDTNLYQFDRSKNDFIEIESNEVDTELENLSIRNAKPSLLKGDMMFYPVYNGFALRDLSIENRQNQSKIRLVFREIEAFNSYDRINSHEGAEISYHLNNVRIRSVVPNQEDVQYQYRTDKMDDWTPWRQDNIFELIGLRHGTHTLSARARTGGEVTPTETISISILVPWYHTWYAYLFYLLIGFSVVYLVYFWQNLSLRKQKEYLLIAQKNHMRDQKKRHQDQLQLVEEEKLQAEYEKIKAQLKSKTIELATKAKENDEKKKILHSIKEKFEKLADNPESIKHRSAEIRKMIESHIEEEDNTFEIQIDELHQEFFERLRQHNDDLTRYDLRLCVYIKIGFDSKEIADLLNIKPSSVYISRSRLRKKLDIGPDEDLHGFLNDF